MKKKIKLKPFFTPSYIKPCDNTCDKRDLQGGGWGGLNRLPILTYIATACLVEGKTSNIQVK